ncbi:hypothetical protein ACTHHL_14610 [Aeribacillus composti]
MGIQAMIFGKHPNRNFHALKPNEKQVTNIAYLIFNGQPIYIHVH